MNSRRSIKQLTPFILLSIFSFIALVHFFVVQGFSRETMGHRFFKVLLGMVCLPVVTDIFLKRILHVRLRTIWILESVLMLGLVYWWIVS